MKKTFLHIVRLVTFLVALQILNVDFYIGDYDEYTSINAGLATSDAADDDDDDTSDTVFDYVTKVVFKKIKAVPGNNKKPNKHLQAHKHMGLKMIQLQQPLKLSNDVYFKEDITFSFVKNYHYQFCKEITPPPPKA